MLGTLKPKKVSADLQEFLMTAVVINFQASHERDLFEEYAQVMRDGGGGSVDSGALWFALHSSTIYQHLPVSS